MPPLAVVDRDVLRDPAGVPLADAAGLLQRIEERVRDERIERRRIGIGARVPSVGVDVGDARHDAGDRPPLLALFYAHRRTLALFLQAHAAPPFRARIPRRSARRPSGPRLALLLRPHRPREQRQAEDLARETGDRRRQRVDVVGVEIGSRRAGFKQVPQAVGAFRPELAAPPAVAGEKPRHDAAGDLRRQRADPRHDGRIERHQRDRPR